MRLMRVWKYGLLLLILSGISYGQTESFTGKLYTQIDLLVDGQIKSKTWIKVSPDGSLLALPSQTFFSAVEGVYPKEIIESAKSRLQPGGLINNRVMRESGVMAEFVKSKNQLLITLISNTNPTLGKPAEAAPEPSVNLDKKDSAITRIDTVEAIADNQIEDTDQTEEEDSSLVAKPPFLAPAQRPTLTESVPQRDTSSKSFFMQTVNYSRSREELFREYFKKDPPPLPDSIEVDIRLNENSIGKLWVRYSKDHLSYSFASDLILSNLQPILSPKIFEKLKESVSPTGKLTLEGVRQSGIVIALNQGTFELKISVPAQLLGKQIHFLRSQPADPYSKKTEGPSRLSAFVNARARQRYTYLQNVLPPTDTTGLNRAFRNQSHRQHRQPSVTHFDGAVNLAGWVVEGDGYLQEKNELNAFDFERKDVRLLHDFPKSAIRFSVGDLLYPTTGYQKILRTGGIGVTRDFNLTPHLIAYPTRDYEFFLEKPAQVKVFINGALIDTKQLDPGTHDLAGFPFVQGESNVAIEITDITGKVENIHFNFIHEPTLLAPGLSAFSFNVGLQSIEDYDQGNALGYKYEKSKPVYTAYYQRGLTEVLTLGAYTQGLTDQGLTGLQATYAMAIGKMDIDVAGSYGLSDPDFASKLGYSYFPKQSSKIGRIVWRNQVEYLGENFKTLFTSVDAENEKFNFLSSVSLPLNFLSVNSGLGYSIMRHHEDNYYAQISASRSWINGWNVSASLRTSLDRQGVSETSVSASVFYTIFTGANGFTAQHRTDSHPKSTFDPNSGERWDQYSSLQWDYNTASPFPVNPRLRAEANFGPQNNDYSVRSTAWENYGQADLNFTRVEPASGAQGGTNLNYTDLTLQSALVFAGGHFGLSRPVSNAFALVEGVKSHANTDIEINPNAEGYDAKYSGGLPGALPNLQLYQISKLRLNPLNSPVGSSITQTEYNLLPTYKSGFFIPVGSDVTAIAIGSLNNENGSPVAFQSFAVFSIDENKLLNIPCFTNGAGNFQIFGVKPGRFEIRIGKDDNQESASFEIPKKFEGFVQLGPLKLQKQRGPKDLKAEDVSGLKHEVK